MTTHAADVHGNALCEPFDPALRLRVTHDGPPTCEACQTRLAADSRAASIGNETSYLRGALQRIADLGGAQGVLARAALTEADTLRRNVRHVPANQHLVCSVCGVTESAHGPELCQQYGRPAPLAVRDVR